MGTEIFSNFGGSRESWLKVMDDGSLEYTVDDSNAWRGWLRTERLTPEEAIKRSPSYADAIWEAIGSSE